MQTVPFEPVVRAFRPVVPGEVLCAQHEAALILDRARRRAEEIVAEAADTVACAAQEARLAACQAAAEEAACIVAEAERLAGARLRGLEVAAVDVALAVAQRVWRTATVDRAEAARAVAEELAARDEPVTIRVHPSDLDACRDLPVAVLGDEGLAPGDCVAVCGGGVLDARATVRARVALEVLASALDRPLEEAGSC